MLVIGLNQIADSIYRVKKPETQGYKIEGVAETKAAAKGEVKKEEKLSKKVSCLTHVTLFFMLLIQIF